MASLNLGKSKSYGHGSNIGITGPLDNNGNLLVDLTTPLPSGSNNIGSITLKSPLDSNGNVLVNLKTPLPTGTNNIGAVVITRNTISATPLSGTTASTAGTMTRLVGTSTLVKRFYVSYNGTGTLSIYAGFSSGMLIANITKGQTFEFICEMNEQVDLLTFAISSTIVSDSYTGAYYL